MDPVVHFEMPFEDRDRMTKFYNQAFGWKPLMLGPEMGDYVVVDTCERDPITKAPIEAGRINGGFFQKTEDAKTPSVVIAVKDIHKAMAEVTKAGGAILPGPGNGEPVQIPGTGLYIGFTDTEGNRVSIIQPDPM